MFCVEPLDDAVLIYIVFLVFFLLLSPQTVVLQLGFSVPTPAMLRRINIF
jgi:hypothetical protein